MTTRTEQDDSLLIQEVRSGVEIVFSVEAAAGLLGTEFDPVGEAAAGLLGSQFDPVGKAAAGPVLGAMVIGDVTSFPPRLARTKIG